MAANELKPCQCGSDVELCRGDDDYYIYFPKCKLTGDRVYTRCYDNPSPEWCPHRVIVHAIAEKEEWRRKRIEIAVKYNEKFKRELIAKNERLSERLNELQTLFPLRQIPEPTNNGGEDE